MNVAILVNREKDPNLTFLHETIQIFEGKAELWMTESFREDVTGVSFCEEEKLFSNSELILVLGGDGTILRASRQAAQYGKPLVGINIGHLGFLSSVELRNLKNVSGRILSGDYEVDERMMLSAKVMRNDQAVFETSALNDVVITRGTFSRLIDLKAYLNESFLCEFPSDGMVVATPTGSTAYALSAGGPVVAPNMDAFVLVPICPHVLNARSMVLPPDGEMKLEITYSESGGATFTADGQEVFPLETGDEIIISACPYKTKLVKLHHMSFYELLNAKLTGKKGEERYEK